MGATINIGNSGAENDYQFPTYSDAVSNSSDFEIGDIIVVEQTTGGIFGFGSREAGTYRWTGTSLEYFSQSLKDEIKENEDNLAQEILDRQSGDVNLQNQITSNDSDITDLQNNTASINHTHVKADITDFNDSDYATAAQGSTADSALQPGDNISELVNDLGYITSFSESDPIFTASPAFGIGAADISNWNAAFSWGDHSLAGYLTSIPTSYLQSGDNISELVNDSGYLTSETDPVFTASPASGITVGDISNWNTAFSWGDHALAGYLTSIPSTYLQSGDNVSELINDVGYITSFTETDPIFQASEASNFVAGDKANLDNQSGVNTGDQNSSQVPFTPSSPLVSTNVQDAIEEVQSNVDNLTTDHGALTGLSDDDHPQYLNETRHDSLPQDNPHGVTATQVGLGNVDNTSDLNKPISTATQSALDGKVDDSQVLTNVPAGAVFTDTVYDDTSIQNDISALEAQDVAFQNDITNLQNSEISQDSAIALNTAKVSANGSINTHSDVDTTTNVPNNGDSLVFDGSNWVPQSISNGFTIFPIWAEESAPLGANSNEWAFGNGDDTPADDGIVIPIDCELFAMSLNVEGGSATVRTVINGNETLTGYQVSASSPSGFVTFSTPLQITAGQVLRFRTILAVGTSSGRVSAWLRVKSSPSSTSILNDLLDVSISGITNGQILQYNGSNFVPANLPAGSQPFISMVKYSNTDTTTNINASTATTFPTDIPIFGNLEDSQNLADFTVSGNTITFNFTGYVEGHASIHVLSTGARNSIQIRRKINGNAEGPVSSSGYIRAASGHNEASLHIPIAFSVVQGQSLSIGTRREGTNATGTTMALAGSSEIYLKRLT